MGQSKHLRNLLRLRLQELAYPLSQLLHLNTFDLFCWRQRVAKHTFHSSNSAALLPVLRTLQCELLLGITLRGLIH